MTESPTWTVLESAIRAGRAPAGTFSSCSSERSAAGSEPPTRAATVSPPRNSTWISSMVCTTCAAVMTLPSGEMSTPEPVSLKLVRPLRVSSVPRARITTTEGVTFLKASPTVSALAAPGSSVHAATSHTPVHVTPVALIVRSLSVDDLHARAGRVGHGEAARGQLLLGRGRGGAGDPEVELAAEARRVVFALQLRAHGVD